MVWTFAWALTMVLADKAELYEWHSSAALTVLALVVNVAVGVGMIFTYMRYLRDLDELQRKVQFDALALAVGVGLVGGVAFSLLAAAGFIADAEASDVIMLIGLTFMAGTIYGQLRYR